jgi:hypothetical protein
VRSEMGVKLTEWVGEEFIFEVSVDERGLTGGMGAVAGRESGDLAKVILAVP